MKTTFFNLLFIFGIVICLNAQVGSIVIHNAQNTNPDFIISLNGIRLNNQYAQNIKFDYLDENNYHVKVLQSGTTALLNFNITSALNYTSIYALNKDNYGNYSLILESKTLFGNTPTNPSVVALTPTVSNVPGLVSNTVQPDTYTGSEFTGVCDAIKKESFESTKFEMAKTFFNTKEVSSAQVLSVMKLFSQEKSKLDFSKYAYSKTYDKQNYYKVYDAFSFSNSKKELAAYMKENP